MSIEKDLSNKIIQVSSSMGGDGINYGEFKKEINTITDKIESNENHILTKKNKNMKIFKKSEIDEIKMDKPIGKLYSIGSKSFYSKSTLSRGS